MSIKKINLKKIIVSLNVLSLLFFSVGVPLVQQKVNSLKEDYSRYLIHVFQGQYKYEQFLFRYDIGYFLNKLVNDKIVNNSHLEFVREIKNVIEMRYRDDILHSNLLMFTNPLDDISDTKKELYKLREMSVEELYELYTKNIEESKSNKISRDITGNSKFYSMIIYMLYSIGALALILSTTIQLLFGERNIITEDD